MVEGMEFLVCGCNWIVFGSYRRCGCRFFGFGLDLELMA